MLSRSHTTPLGVLASILSICLKCTQQVMGPPSVPHICVMRNRIPGNGRNPSVLVEDTRGCRRPQPYCFVASREPLRYPQAPTICNIIMVPTELRCSYSWPTGVNPESFAKDVMPKLDPAASEHVVWSTKFLDNYELLPVGLFRQQGSCYW